MFILGQSDPNVDEGKKMSTQEEMAMLAEAYAAFHSPTPLEDRLPLGSLVHPAKWSHLGGHGTPSIMLSYGVPKTEGVPEDYPGRCDCTIGVLVPCNTHGAHIQIMYVPSWLLVPYKNDENVVKRPSSVCN